MPWVVVWPVLVLGALVGGFFLGRDLWHRVRAFRRAAAAASGAVARLSDHRDELTAVARRRHPVPLVALSRDPADLRADLAAARAVRDRRIDARQARYRLVMDRWRDLWQ